MSLAPRHFFLTPPGLASAALVLGLAGAVALGVPWAVRRLPAIPAGSIPDPAVTRHTGSRQVSLPMESWSVFRMDGQAVRDVSNLLAGRFRLAGTFRIFQPDGAVQKGVLMDLARDGLTLVVAVGESLEDGIQVKAIEADRLELVQQDVSVVLTLDHSVVGGGTNEAAGGPVADSFAGYPVVNRNRFGIETEANHWVFERRSVLDYYNDVLADADRLVALFDSLKPLYNEKRKIEGYVLVPEGEQEFFKDVGLKEGDVIRKVNSVPLMNRRVAESFIRDFGQDDLSAAVLEVERDGEPVRLVYEVR